MADAGYDVEPVKMDLSSRESILAIDEFNGPRGDFYKNMFAKCPAGRPGTAGFNILKRY